MVNRLATLEMYVVPEGSPGRAEATPFMDTKGNIYKQNLIVNVYDLSQRRDWNTLPSFYTCYFKDTLPVFERMQAIANQFLGTHSRRSQSQWGQCDDASFRIAQKQELINYFEGLRNQQLEQTAQTPIQTHPSQSSPLYKPGQGVKLAIGDEPSDPDPFLCRGSGMTGNQHL